MTDDTMLFGSTSGPNEKMEDPAKRDYWIDFLSKIYYSCSNSQILFQQATIKIFRHAGYKTAYPRGFDRSASFIASMRDERIAVLVKPVSGKKVGIDAIEKVYAAIDTCDCSSGAVVGCYGFSPNAERRAEKCGVKLIRNLDLVRLASNCKYEEFLKLEVGRLLDWPDFD